MVNFSFDQYSVNVKSTVDKVSQGAAIAVIYAYRGETLVGALLFYPENKLLPNARIDTNKDVIFLSYSINQLHAILDILRNEKPLWLYYHNATNAGFSSGREPVGEEESA